MADKRLSIADIIFLIILLAVVIFILFFVAGCASQTSRVEDSNHYRAEVQQVYPCPECRFPIPDKDVSPNMRIGNTCPSCRAVFFGKPIIAKKYGPYGPRNYGPTSVYQSEVNYQRFGVGWYSFKETSTGFSEISGYFHDNKVKSYRVIPYWRTRRYSY